MTAYEQLELDLEPFGVWLERQPPPSWSSLAMVPLDVRARVVRVLCAKTSDVDERHDLVAAAFLGPDPDGAR